MELLMRPGDENMGSTARANYAIIAPDAGIRRFPHLFAQEAKIWGRFLAENGHKYTGFYYDVRLGKMARKRDDLIEPYRSMADRLAHYRIDVIGIRNGRLDVFEVKPNASISALFQVLAYKEMLLQEWEPSERIVANILTDYARPGLEDSAAVNNVWVTVV